MKRRIAAKIILRKINEKGTLVLRISKRQLELQEYIMRIFRYVPES